MERSSGGTVGVLVFNLQIQMTVLAVQYSLGALGLCVSSDIAKPFGNHVKEFGRQTIINANIVRGADHHPNTGGLREF